MSLSAEIFERSVAFRTLVAARAAAFFERLLTAAGGFLLSTKTKRSGGRDGRTTVSSIHGIGTGSNTSNTSNIINNNSSSSATGQWTHLSRRQQEQNKRLQSVLVLVDAWASGFGDRYPALAAGRAALELRGFVFPPRKTRGNVGGSGVGAGSGGGSGSIVGDGVGTTSVSDAGGVVSHAGGVGAVYGSQSSARAPTETVAATLVLTEEAQEEARRVRVRQALETQVERATPEIFDVVAEMERVFELLVPSLEAFNGVFGGGGGDEDDDDEEDDGSRHRANDNRERGARHRSGGDIGGGGGDRAGTCGGGSVAGNVEWSKNVGSFHDYNDEDNAEEGEGEDGDDGDDDVEWETVDAVGGVRSGGVGISTKVGDTSGGGAAGAGSGGDRGGKGGDNSNGHDTRAADDNDYNNNSDGGGNSDQDGKLEGAGDEIDGGDDEGEQVDDYADENDEYEYDDSDGGGYDSGDTALSRLDMNQIVQAYGLGSASYQLTIEIPTTAGICEQSSDNEVLFRHLADGVLRIRKRFLPLVAEWRRQLEVVEVVARGDRDDRVGAARSSSGLRATSTSARITTHSINSTRSRTNSLSNSLNTSSSNSTNECSTTHTDSQTLARRLDYLQRRLELTVSKWEDLVAESEKQRLATVAPSVVSLPLSAHDLRESQQSRESQQELEQERNGSKRRRVVLPDSRGSQRQRPRRVELTQ